MTYNNIDTKVLVGRNYTGETKYGEVVSFEVSKKPDFLGKNLYKIITATAALVGIYTT